jgi:hypothetical protein
VLDDLDYVLFAAGDRGTSSQRVHPAMARKLVVLARCSTGTARRCASCWTAAPCRRTTHLAELGVDDFVSGGRHLLSPAARPRVRVREGAGMTEKELTRPAAAGQGGKPSMEDAVGSYAFPSRIWAMPRLITIGRLRTGFPE